MTLRKKTCLYLTCALSVFLLSAAFIAHWVFDRHLTALENEQVIHNLSRARNTLQVELNHIEEMAKDWSSWDDTYRFVEDLSPSFIETNLPDSTFKNLGLDVLLIYDSDMRLVYGKAFALTQGVAVPLPEKLLTQLSKTSAQLLGGSPKTGILPLPGQLMLLSCQPILTSSDTGPARGTLIMGRNLNAGELDRIAETAQVSMGVYAADTLRLPEQLTWTDNTADRGGYAIGRNEENLNGYLRIDDIYGTAAVIIQTHEERNITLSGNIAFHYLLASFALVGLGLAAFIIWMVDRLVTSRLARTSREVDRVGASGDFSQRLSVRGRDELARMAEHINCMLSSLESFHQNTDEQEKLYRAVMEQSADAIALIDQESKRLLKANAAFQQMLGDGDQDLTRLTLYDLLMESPEVIDRETADISRNGQAQLGVKLLRGKDGQLLEIKFSASLVLLAGKQVICVVGHNITELKQAQKALQAQLHFMQSLLEAIPDPLFYKDAQGVYLGGNRAFEAFLGKSKSEFVGKSVFELAPRELAESYHRADSQLLAQGADGVQVYETTVAAADQLRHVIFHKANFTDDCGKLAGLIGTIVDISKNKAIEAELERERRQLFDLLDNLPAIIYMVAEDYSITFANRRFRNVFGSPAQIPCYDVLHGCETSCLGQPPGRCGAFAKIARGEALIVERQYRDGQTYQVRKYPLIDADGTLRMLVLATTNTEPESDATQSAPANPAAVATKTIQDTNNPSSLTMSAR